MDDIIGALKTYTKDQVIDIKLTNGSQNHVYICKTNTKSYIIKQYSKDAIRNNDDLKKRKEQINISRIWNKNGINCVLPLTDIFKYHNNYYIIYPYLDCTIYNEDELSIEQVIILAKEQAMIHKLDIKTWLPNHCNQVQTYDKRLKDFVDKVNNSIPTNNLVICQNDYKSHNILWMNNKPILIDMDAVNYNHPTYSLLESAHAYAYRNHIIDFDYYKAYIEAYKEEYNKPLLDIEKAIYGCWNGKLQWISYLVDTRPNDPGIDELTNQILEYEKHINEIKEILKK